ncbi:MAG: RNA polymerase sigma factor [Bacteroidota bacterium]
MSQPISSEHSWMELIRSRDEGAIKQLIDRFQGRVRNTVLTLVQNQYDAEELTQDVFLEVITSAGHFRGESSLSTWIYRIAVNKSLDHLKKKKRKKRFAFLSSLWDTSGHPGIDIPDFIHPGVLLERQEESVFFFKALDQLPENQRTAVVLALVEGLSYEEIGQVMKTSVSSVESLIFRGRQNLKKILSNYYGRTASKK